MIRAQENAIVSCPNDRAERGASEVKPLFKKCCAAGLCALLAACGAAPGPGASSAPAASQNPVSDPPQVEYLASASTDSGFYDIVLHGDGTGNLIYYDYETM